MTEREREILEIIKRQPDIDQSEIASRLNITRSSVAVHISNLQKKGHISGRVYVVNDGGYVVGIGAANVDIHGRSKNPIIMRDSNPGSMHISVGGVTRNVCENFARLGGSVKLLTALGSDVYADMIRRECEAVGMDLSGCMVVENHTSSTYISVLDEHGDMYVALSDMSVLQKMDMSFILKRESIIRKAKLITFDPGLPEAVIDGVTSMFGGTVPVFCDPVSSAYAARLKPFVGRIHTLKPNRMELGILSGMPVETADDVRAACAALLNRGVRRIFVSLGREGCYYADEEGRERKKALRPLEEMVNATGAGDAFMAAVIYSFVNGFDLERTLDYALAAGIAAVSDENTINPYMGVDMLEQIIKQRGQQQ